MSLTKRSGYVLIEVVIALSLIVLIALFSSIKVMRDGHHIQNTADRIATIVRDSQQYYRMTFDARTKVKIEYTSTGCVVIGYRKGNEVERVQVPDSCILSWSKYDDSEKESSKNYIDTTLMFRREGIYSVSDNKSGFSIYITGKKTKKFIKLTIVPTSGRVYIYDET